MALITPFYDVTQTEYVQIQFEQPRGLDDFAMPEDRQRKSAVQARKASLKPLDNSEVFQSEIVSLLDDLSVRGQDEALDSKV